MKNHLQNEAARDTFCGPPIPSREEFHRDFAGLIFAADFNTNRPNPYRNVAHTRSERAVHSAFHHPKQE